MIKTTLVPGAPWPSKDSDVKDRANPKQVDINFEAWVEKQSRLLKRRRNARTADRGNRL